MFGALGESAAESAPRSSAKAYPGPAETTVVSMGVRMRAETDGGEPTDSGLHGVPWFADCTEEQLDQVARIAERLRVQAGEVILREGRLGRELFVILQGVATVTRAGRVVNILHAGDYFGELSAIEASPRSATVTATTDLDVLIVGPREFETIMDIPGFRNALLSGMSRRIRAADDKLASHDDQVEDSSTPVDGVS